MVTEKAALYLGSKVKVRNLPWLTDESIDFISEKILTGEIRDVLEFGSGASTLWLAKQGINLISAEDNRAWYDFISTKLGELDPELTANIDYHLVTEPRCNDLDDPKKIVTDISVICNEFVDKSFDLVIVDGSMRLNCVLSSYDLVRPGRYLLLDNDERSLFASFPSYKQIHNEMSDWSKVSYTQHGPDRTGWHPPHHWITTIWTNLDNPGESNDKN